MNRSTAREIAIQLCFAGANGKLSADELLDSFFAEEHYASLAAEDELYSEYPDDKQMDYIPASSSSLTRTVMSLTALLSATLTAGRWIVSPKRRSQSCAAPCAR